MNAGMRVCLRVWRAFVHVQLWTKLLPVQETMRAIAEREAKAKEPIFLPN